MYEHWIYENSPITVQTIVRIRHSDTLSTKISQPIFKSVTQNNQLRTNFNQTQNSQNTNNYPTSSQFSPQPINMQPRQVKQNFPSNLVNNQLTKYLKPNPN